MVMPTTHLAFELTSLSGLENEARKLTSIMTGGRRRGLR